MTEDEPDTQEQPAMWSIDTAYAKALPWKAAADKSMGGSEKKKPLPPIQRLPRYEAETPAEALELGLAGGEVSARIIYVGKSQSRMV